MTFLYKFWKKARVYYTLSISRGGGAQAPGPPPLDSPLDYTIKISFQAKVKLIWYDKCYITNQLYCTVNQMRNAMTMIVNSY